MALKSQCEQLLLFEIISCICLLESFPQLKASGAEIHFCSVKLIMVSLSF